MDELKPDPKQWIPIYGVYKAIRDVFDDKPLVISSPFLLGCYQGIWFGMILIILSKL